MNTKALATKIQELMDSGVSLEKALEEVTKTRAPIVDRVAWISELDNISELRKATKIAFAKKSKTKSGSGNLEAIERYEAEIKAGQDRLKELLAQVTDWRSAKDLGEDAKGYTNRFIIDLSEEIDTKLEAITDITKSALRALIKLQPEDMIEVPEEVKDTFQERLLNKDMRVVTLVKKIHLLDKDIKKESEKIAKSKEKKEKTA